MADQEHLDLLTRGVLAWNQWKGDTHEIPPAARWNLCYDADLSGADLGGADLNGVNFGNVDLAEANLAGAFLVGACLADAELAETNFTGAHLRGADLSGANICAANFSHADLSNADLRGADLSESCFQGANLSGAHLSQVHFQGAMLNGANFSEASWDSSLLAVSLHRAAIRSAKEAGAVIRQPYTRRQEARGHRTFWFKRKAQGLDIMLYPRPSNRSVRLLGLALLFVIGGIWIVCNPENLMQVIMGTLIVLFFGLGVLLFLLPFLSHLFRQLPLLVIDDEGIEYFSSSLLEAIEGETMTPRTIQLPWKEIGAIGFITTDQTTSFAVYASAKRWRSGWSPSILLPQSLLPISIRQLLALIRERYEMQVEAYHIEYVEIVDTSSPLHKKKKV